MVNAWEPLWVVNFCFLIICLLTLMILRSPAIRASLRTRKYVSIFIYFGSYCQREICIRTLRKNLQLNLRIVRKSGSQDFTTPRHTVTTILSIIASTSIIWGPSIIGKKITLSFHVNATCSSKSTEISLKNSDNTLNQDSLLLHTTCLGSEQWPASRSSRFLTGQISI